MKCPFKECFGNVVNCTYLGDGDSGECTDFYQCPKFHDSWCCDQIRQQLKAQIRSDERTVNEMPRCSDHHMTLNKDGEGKCSVPMWRGSAPAGFCDRVAYGVYEYREDGYQGYVPYLACFVHGGPMQKKEKEK